MELKLESKQLGDLKVTVQQFPAMKAFSLLSRLLEVAGGALGELAGMDPATELSVMGGIMGSVLSRVDARKATELVPEILGSTSVLVPDARGGREYPLNSTKNIDLVFSGRLGLMFQAIAFAIQVNFSDFMHGSGDVLPAPRDAATS